MFFLVFLLPTDVALQHIQTSGKHDSGDCTQPCSVNTKLRCEPDRLWLRHRINPNGAGQKDDDICGGDVAMACLNCNSDHAIPGVMFFFITD